jgi:hypothetical protein
MIGIFDGVKATTLWHGPHTIGPGTYYIIDAPKRVLQALLVNLRI